MDITILGIESSCDETAAAIVDGTAPHERAAIGPFTGTSI